MNWRRPRGSIPPSAPLYVKADGREVSVVRTVLSALVQPQETSVSFQPGRLPGGYASCRLPGEQQEAPVKLVDEMVHGFLLASEL